MSQISDVNFGGAANAIRSKQPPSMHNMTDAMLADEHRGQSFAKRRAEDRLKDIEAELSRRGLKNAKGALSFVECKDTIGLVDLKRLRAERPDIVAQYARPGSMDLWSSRTLSAEERG